MAEKSTSRIWHSPRSASHIAGRNVSFLELFYDLVYVVIIAELAHLLVDNVDVGTVFSFIFLFVLMWWAWFNAAYYHNLHGEDDVRTRTYAFLQMGILIVIAVFIHDATGSTYQGFATAYAGFLAFLAFLWWRTGVHDPSHRSLTVAFVAPYGASVLLLLMSLLIPASFRLPIWIAVLFLMVVVPTLISSGGLRWEYMSGLEMTSPSLRERFKLFTIIVLGETIIAVTTGISRLDLTLWNGALGSMGLLLAFGLWWMYFDYSSEHPVKEDRGWFWGWNFIHLPIWMGITMVAPAVLTTLLLEGGAVPDGVRWLLTGAIAMALISIAVLVMSIRVEPELEHGYRTGSMLMAGAGITSLIIGLLGSQLTAWVLLLLLCIILMVPIAYTFRLRLACMDRLECNAFR